MESKGETKGKAVRVECPYCGGRVSKRGWVVSEYQLDAQGNEVEVDQMVHQKCQKEQNAY